MRSLVRVARNGLLQVGVSVAMLAVTSIPAQATSAGPTTGPTSTDSSDGFVHWVMGLGSWVMGRDGGTGKDVPMSGGERTTSAGIGVAGLAVGGGLAAWAVGGMITAGAIAFWPVTLTVLGAVGIAVGAHFLFRALWGTKKDNTYHPQQPPTAPVPTVGTTGVPTPGSGTPGPGGNGGPGAPQPNGGGGFPHHGPVALPGGGSIHSSSTIGSNVGRTAQTSGAIVSGLLGTGSMNGIGVTR